MPLTDTGGAGLTGVRLAAGAGGEGVPLETGLFGAVCTPGVVTGGAKLGAGVAVGALGCVPSGEKGFRATRCRLPGLAWLTAGLFPFAGLAVGGALVTRNGMGGTSSERLGPASTGVVAVVAAGLVGLAGGVTPVAALGVAGGVGVLGVGLEVVGGSVGVTVGVLVAAGGVVGRFTPGSVTSPVCVPKYQTAIRPSTNAPNPP